MKGSLKAYVTVAYNLVKTLCCSQTGRACADDEDINITAKSQSLGSCLEDVGLTFLCSFWLEFGHAVVNQVGSDSRGLEK